MAGITGVRGSPSINESFQSAPSSLPSVEEAQAAFRRTFINKLDEQGNPRFYNIIDLETGKPTGGRDSLLSYIEDVATGNLYLDEDRSTVATKCIMIAFLGNPLYALTREVWALTKMLLVVSTIGLDTIRKLGEKFYEGNLQGIDSICWEAVCETGSALKEGIWGIVSTPFYAVGVELAALYGTFDQYRGRKWVAAIEHAWQNGVSYQEDHKEHVRNPDENRWVSFVRDVKQARVPYLANCFQVRGNIHQSDIRVIRSESL